MKKYLIILFFIFLNFSIKGQQKISPIKYEIGCQLYSGFQSKVDAKIIIEDSSLKFEFQNKTTVYNILKYSESSSKYLLSDGIDEFVFTISSQTGKMKGYNYNFLGIFEFRNKNAPSVTYGLNVISKIQVE